MSLGLVSPILNRGVRSRWVSTLPASSKMLTIDAAGDVSYTDIPTAAWGSITGTLSNQTDLQNALNAKLSLSGGTMTGAINVPLGAAATESIRFASNTGIYSAGEGFVNLNASGMLQWNGAAGQLWLAVNSATTQLALGSSADVRLFRDAAAILAQRNGVNAQTFRVYNTFTDASNYERGQLAWESNEFRIGATAAGTGTQRNTVLGSWSSGGTFTAKLAIEAGGTIVASGDFDLTSSGSRIMRFRRSGYVTDYTFEIGANDTLGWYDVRNGRYTFRSTNTNFLINETGVLRTLIGTTSDDGTSKLQVLGSSSFNGQLTNALGTITASTPLTLTQTWNDAAVTFTGALVNVTDTASASGSLLMDLQVGGSSKFNVSKSGVITALRFKALSQAEPYTVIDFYNNQYLARVVSGAGLTFEADVTTIRGIAGATTGVLSINGHGWLTTDAAQTLAQRNGTNAQTFRVYNTYTDASNYERGKIEWSSNVLRIGTEKAGTGSARALELQTDGTTRLTVATNGNLTGAGLTLDNSNSQNIGLDVRPWITIKNNSATLAGYLSNGGSIFSSGASGTTDLGLRAVGAFGISVNNSQTPTITISSASLVTIADASDIAVGTTTGTKIGTATTQKIGFYNKTPVVQPAAVADATDAASVITQLNLLLSRMRDLGLIAT